MFSVQGDVLQRPEGESRGARGNKRAGQRDDEIAPGVHLHQSGSHHTLKCPENTRSCQSISGKMTAYYSESVYVAQSLSGTHRVPCKS